MKKALLISSITSSILLGNITETRFFIQDYLDFGQNKGKYIAGTKGVLFTERNSNAYGDYADRSKFFDITMPDFIGPVDTAGNKTFLGGSYIATAKHVFDNTKRYTFESPDYNYEFKNRENFEPDRSYARYNKFITSSDPVELLEVSPDKPLDTTRYTHFWRSGKGFMKYVTNDDKVYKVGWGTTRHYVITGGTINYNGILNDTRIAFNRKNVYFSNMVTEGDSGSPMFAWDSYEKKWVVIGFAKDGDMATIAHYTPHRQSDLDSIIAHNTNPTVYLDGKESTWDGTSINNTKTFATTMDKDIIFKGGGTLILTNHINQKSGGFYFDENQNYTITSDGVKDWAWMGGGVSIGAGTTVTWDIAGYTVNDGLFKVGKGTLHVIKKNISWLNLGDGKVILDTTENTFKHYVLVSGRATLQLAQNKASTIDTNTLFFSERGGNFDINGNSLSFDKFQASDIGAKIINTGNQATITLTNASQNAHLYHGQIGDNINISINQEASKALAFDGSINNPNGTLTQQNGTLIFQGHPYIHAYFDFDDDNIMQNTPSQSSQRAAWHGIKETISQEVLRAPTSLTQNDWEDRVFVFKEITTQNGSVFTLGRNATLLADLNLIGTSAKFGGDAQIYIDRYDGENVVYKGSNTHEFKQQLTKGASEKNDSFFYEGNLTLTKNSSLEVQNTSTNPLRFGNFTGTDKTSKENGALGSKKLTYQLSIDNTSDAKIAFLELYGAEILGTKNTEAITANNGGNLTVQNLTIHDGTSTIKGETRLVIDKVDSDLTNPKIIFSNLEDKIQLLDKSSITLSKDTILELNTQSIDWKNINYKKTYTLITSKTSISDHRFNKDIVTNSELPSFLILKNIQNENNIGFTFINKETVLLDQNWFEQYIQQIISTDQNTQSAKNFNQAIKGNEKLLKALLETNLKGEKIYQDVYLDMLIQKAGSGDIEGLRTYLNDINSKISKSTTQTSSLLTNSIYTSSQYSYLKNIQSTLQARVALKSKNSPYKKEYLAYEEEANIVSLSSRSDFTTLSPLRGYLTQENKNKHLWIDTHGGFFSGSHLTFYSLGLSGGYDHTLIAQDEKYFTLGASLHYMFSQYKQNEANTQSHNVIGGLHTQYIYKTHEILFNLYGGGSFGNNHLSSTQKTANSNSIATQAEGYYKYRFDLLKTENSYHAIKPVFGVGYTWFYIPKESFGEFGGADFIQISQVNIHNPFIKGGAEYNVATERTQTVFAIFATYNIKSLHERDVFIGTAKSIQYDLNLYPLWIEASLAGSYLITNNFSLKYMLATQYVPQSHYGISGSIGGSWSF